MCTIPSHPIPANPIQSNPNHNNHNHISSKKRISKREKKDKIKISTITITTTTTIITPSPKSHFLSPSHPNPPTQANQPNPNQTKPNQAPRTHPRDLNPAGTVFPNLYSHSHLHLYLHLPLYFSKKSVDIMYSPSLTLFPTRHLARISTENVFSSRARAIYSSPPSCVV